MNLQGPEHSATSTLLSLPDLPGASPATPPTIPNHQLLRLIGQGSYGEVWLARTVTGVYRAVKVVRRARFDSDRPYEREFEGLKRFEPVSRAHTSQVDILHVGRTDDCFYYVMELADDASTENQSDRRYGSWNPETYGVVTPSDYVPKTLKVELTRLGRMPIEQCVQLGLSLTRALGHLHDQGLIHRDIKPANIIFVRGEPKLADIGLVANQSATCSFVGTEGYLPPEGPGTPQADIFSLGKVLYEAATGKDRREFPELPIRSSASSSEPKQTPSNGPDSIAVNADEEKALIELNAVILKACMPDGRRRYQTAGEMHNDLLLLLAGKSVRRAHAIERRLAVMTRVGVMSLAILMLFAVPFFMAIKEARRANVERLRAEAGERTAREVLDTLNGMLKAVGPSAAMGLDTKLLKYLLQQKVHHIYHDLSGSPEAQMELLGVLASVYEDLGLYQQENDMACSALDLGIQKLGPGHPSVANAERQIGAAYAGLYETVGGNTNLAQAEYWLSQAIVSQIKACRTNEHLEIARSFNDLGKLLLSQNRKREAETILRETLYMRQKLHGKDHPEISETLNYLAQAVKDRVGEPEILYREALRIQQELLPEMHPDIVNTLNNLAITLPAKKRKEAVAMLRDALRMARSIWGNDHLKVAETLQNLGNVLRDKGDLEEAEQALTESIELGRKLYADNLGKLGTPMDNLVDILLREAKYTQAEALLDSWITPKVLADPNSSGLIRVRAEFYARRGRWKEAIADTRLILTNRPDQYWNHFTLATLLVASGDHQGYRELCASIPERFANTDEASVAELMAKSCLLLPESGGKSEKIAELAQRAVRLGRDHRSLPWFELCHGLSEYRLGHYQSALDLMAVARRPKKEKGVPPDYDLEFTASVISSMALYQLNQLEPAEQSLSKAAHIASRLPNLQSGDLGPDWYDLLVGHTLLREANSLIRGEAATPLQEARIDPVH